LGADLRPPALTATRRGARLRALVRALLPAAGNCVQLLRTLPLRWRGAQQVFTAIHRQNAWQGDESASGPGSSLAATATLRQELPRLLSELGCASLLDAPCGDLRWIRETLLPTSSYCGVDIVAEVIAANRRRDGGPGRTFLHLDLRHDPLPKADLVLCRDCLVHLSYRDAWSALANFRASGAVWLLTTTFPAHRRNRDAVTGDWRPLNLELPPFRLPPPVALLNERCPEESGRYADKSLGLWRLDDLPPPR
jgi:hypothetical protein